jgi:hypothetical protein
MRAFRTSINQPEAGRMHVFSFRKRKTDVEQRLRRDLSMYSTYPTNS